MSIYFILIRNYCGVKLHMYFDRIIVIGSGKIACECSKILRELNVNHVVMENNPSQISMLRSQCKKNGIKVIEKNDFSIESTLLDYAEGKTLIISANNEHIFKSEIFKDNITIINFHYGLLPDYRGMNIPSWVIFNKEECAGVTWHYVNQNVDDGRIICQACFDIGEYDTAIDVTSKVMTKGVELFDSFICEFLNAPIAGIDNELSACKHVYRKKDLPNDGFISCDSASDLILRTLRAYDYGRTKYIQLLRICVNGENRTIERYRVYKDNILVIGSEVWKSDFVFEKDNFRFELGFERMRK